jgi:hypothetical protein
MSPITKQNAGWRASNSTSIRRGGPEQTWLEYVGRLVWEKGNLDLASWFACRRAASLGVPASLVIGEIADRIRMAGDYPRRGKLEQQWRRAAMSVGSEPGSPEPIVPITRPVFDPEYARRIAERVPPSVDLRWIRRHSPIPPGWDTPADYLSAIFRPGDQVLVFSDYLSQGEALYQNWSLKPERDALKSFVSGHQDGVWFLSNPVDGQYHFNPRQDSMSRRREESITAFRHVVLESDCQPAEQWLRILVQLKLSIVSIVSSGGKSLHAIAKISACSKEEWDQAIRRLMPWLVKVGADRAAMTAVRLTRLPGCRRGENLQELLYLNPRAIEGPIWKPRDNS